MDVNNNSDDEYIENIENIEEIYQLHNQERVTKPVMTIYEKAKILGARAVQISRNAPIFSKFKLR
jgi:RNA polymerase Rpb6.